MAKVLSKLLDVKEAKLRHGIQDLEKASSERSVDVSLIGDVAKRAALAQRELGLDPRDTTAQEFYYALRARAKRDNQILAEQLGGLHGDSIKEMTPHIIRYVSSTVANRPCWLLKNSSAKKFIKKLPPKKLMAALGYRSVASLLKHESPSELMVLVRYVEDETWLRAFNEQYTQLKPSDFELRDMAVLKLDKAVYLKLLAPVISRLGHHVLHSKEMGVLALVPTSTVSQSGFTLASVGLMLHYRCEIFSLGLLVHLTQTQKNFSQLVCQMLVSDNEELGYAAKPFHWRHVHKHLTRHPVSASQRFGNHITPDDVRAEPIDEMLSSVHDELGFWQQRLIAAKHGPIVVTANVIDLALDELIAADYGDHSVKFFRRELDNELYSRYLAHGNIEEMVLAKLG